MSFTPLGDTLNDKMGKDLGLKAQLETSRVLDIASEVISELFKKDMASHAKPLFLKNRTLTISCTSSSMAQEIRLNQAMIVAEINRRLGFVEVDRIRYLA